MDGWMDGWRSLSRRMRGRSRILKRTCMWTMTMISCRRKWWGMRKNPLFPKNQNEQKVYVLGAFLPHKSCIFPSPRPGAAGKFDFRGQFECLAESEQESLPPRTTTMPLLVFDPETLESHFFHRGRL
eukprot:9367761-Pyramimonas_sp.AAC.1